MSQRIQLAENDQDILSCYPVMVELRPDLQPEEFLHRVKKQSDIAGFKLAYLFDKQVKAVAGFRMSECFAWKKFLYVDDLVAKSTERSKGYGGELFDWIVEYARTQNCNELHLDSAVHRFAAHRFYMDKKMIIVGHHFSLTI
jgi:GNAT superfamily N-acetyltransferase